MPSSVRLLLGGAVGLVVWWSLLTGAAAQPGSPGYPLTMTAQAGGAPPTSTPTATTLAAATATTPAAGAVAPNSATIAGGRGRVVNVRDRGFTVLWTTDADVVAQVSYGTSAALGSTATDQRGPAFAGKTHFFEIGGLTPNTTYFFDLISGGAADNNAGQHYQIRTGPELAGGPPLGNQLVGDVRQPGGVAPAGGALVWVVVKDANGQGTGGGSQLLGVLAGGDGRFQIGLQPRSADLGAYFQYSTEGDLIEASARHDTGSVDLGLNTAITQGGTSPSNAQLILVATPAAATAPSPTLTLTPAGSAATPVPTATPQRTAAPAAAAPAAAAVSPTPMLVAPLQLPTLKEMALAQGYPLPGAPVVTVATPVQAAPIGYPGAAPAPQSAPPAQTGAGAQPPAPQPLAPASFPPSGSAPVATAGVPPAQTGATAPLQPQPPAGAPVGAAPGAQTGAPIGGAPAPGAQQGSAPGAIPPASQVGAAPGAVGSGAPKPQGSFGQPPGRDPLLAPQPAGPPTTVAPAPAPLATLANLPPVVSALFYGGILIVALGGGLAIWSVLSGTGWRPR